MPLAILRVTAWLGVAAIIGLSVVPGDQRPHVLQVAKLEHLGAYFLVGIVLVISFSERNRCLLAGLLLTVLAGMLELAQLIIPGRVSNVSDWAISSVGAWAGIGVVLVMAWTYERLIIQGTFFRRLVEHGAIASTTDSI
jgi:VanZ family protein